MIGRPVRVHVLRWMPVLGMGYGKHRTFGHLREARSHVRPFLRALTFFPINNKNRQRVV